MLIFVTTELAHTLTALRLRQTAELLAWMAGSVPEPEALTRALEHVTEALRIMDSTS